MRNWKNDAVAMKSVKKEVIVLDLDDEDEYATMLDSDQTDTSAGVDVWDTKIDHQYMKLLDSFREDRNSYLKDNPLRSIKYEVDNGGHDKREYKVLTNKRSREDYNTIRVIKKNVEPKPHVQASPVADKNVEPKPHVQASPVADKNVETMLITQHKAVAGKKVISEREMVMDETYKSYLTWLVENSKSSRTKEIQVKCEEDTISLSDSDIIMVEDHPFLDEEDSPFVPSKSYKVIDLEEEVGDQHISWFRKELMKILKQPYNEDEFKELYKEASTRKVLTRCRELQDGRELSYKTNQTRPSYLDEFPKFRRMFRESLVEIDRHRALNLLRGFIFYLTKVARDDAFKPWRDGKCLKITCSDKNSILGK